MSWARNGIWALFFFNRLPDHSETRQMGFVYTGLHHSFGSEFIMPCLDFMHRTVISCLP